MRLKKLVWRQEEKLFKPLESVFGQRRVSPKVGLKEVIPTSDRRLTQEGRDYMFRGAHFDFLVCDDERYPIMAYELDGAPHQFDEKQIRRDELKDSICEKFDLPLFRMRVDEITDLEELSVMLLEAMGSIESPDEEAREWTARTIAGQIRREYEMVVNPDFARFMEWWASLEEQKQMAVVGVCLGSSGAIRLVRELGTEEAIRVIEWRIRYADRLTEIQDTSGFSQEEWESVGEHAVIQFTKLCEARLDERGMLQEEYENTREFRVLRAAYRTLIRRTFEDGMAEDNLAFWEEWTGSKKQVLASFLNLMEHHPVTIEMFNTCISDLAEDIIQLSQAEAAGELDAYNVVSDYLAKIIADQIISA